MKTILIVSFYYWPYSLIGSKRTIFISNYFAKNGYNIIVVKADDIYYKNNIDKTQYISSKIKIINVKIKNSKNRNFNIFKFYSTFKKSIETIIKNNRIDLIYFSGGPFYYFSLGPYFKKKYKIKYILDFRDIWYRHPYYEMHKYTGIEKFTDKYLENKCIKYADLVIDVTKTASYIRKKIYKKYLQEKFIVIYNGFNSIDLKNINIDKANKKKFNFIINEKNIFKIGIFGKFDYYSYYYIKLQNEKIKKSKILFNSNVKSEYNSFKYDQIEWLLELMDYFNIKEKIKEYGYDSLKIYVIGKEEKDFITKVKNRNMEKYFSFLGVMNYKEGIKFLDLFNAYLLNNAYKIALGTKIFDYIFLNKPILALMDKDSEIANLLSNFQTGFVCSNYGELQKNLELILKNEIKLLDINTKKIENYSREKQTKILLNIVNKIAN